MQDQDEFITRDTNFEDVAVVANDRANLEDVDLSILAAHARMRIR